MVKGTCEKTETCPAATSRPRPTKRASRSCSPWAAGDGTGSSPLIVSHPDAEERYVKSVIAIVNDYDYDEGSTLIGEYPGHTDRDHPGFGEAGAPDFASSSTLIAAAKGRPMVVTMAASSNPGTLRWLAKDFLLETMDWINVMTYDYTGDWTNYAGHHSPLIASSKQPGGAPRSTALTMKYLLEERGLPANRLAVGIPLYGRGFAVSEPYASTKNATKTGVPKGDYANLHRLEHEKGWTRTWDGETHNPWLTSPDRKVVVGYDDAESVAIKTEWAMKQGFRGVFFWQIGGDLLADDTNPLQEASRVKLDQSGRQGPVGLETRMTRHVTAVETVRERGRPGNERCRRGSPVKLHVPG